MKRKVATIVLSILCTLVCAVATTACGSRGGGEEPTHTHEYAWVDNGDGTHKQHCSAPGCDAPDIHTESHVWGADGKCTKCDAVKPEEKPEHTHRWAQAWTNDETHHWHECTAEGCPVTETAQKDGYAAHDFRRNTCETCGLTVTETAGIEYKSVSGGYEVSGYKGSGKIVMIPAEHDGAAVVSVGDSAFKNAEVRYIRLPDSVKEIGQYAFWCCEASEIDLGEGVQNVGYCALGGCENLTEATLPESATQIATYAFYMAGCQKVTIRAAVTAVPDRMFYGCELLQKVVLPQGVTEIGSYAFYGCKSLEDVNTDNVTTVKQYGFYEAEKFDMDTSDLTTIGANAFGKSGIKTANVRAQTLESYAFDECLRLIEANILDTCTLVKTNAFYGCTALRTVHIGAGVTNLSQNSSAGYGGVFDGCFALQTLTIDDGNTVYASENNCILGKDKRILYFCNATGNIPSCVKTLEENSFGGCNAEEVVVPDTVTSISRYAFTRCPLESLHIGKGVQLIGSGILRYCPNVKKITVSAENTQYTAVDNCLLEGTTLKAGGSAAVIPDTVKKIDMFAFAGNTGLVSVTIPASVTQIDSQAFEACRALETLSLHEGLTTIGSYAFSNCAVKAIAVPDSLTSVAVNSFYGCAAIESITGAANNTKYAVQGNCLVDKSTKTLILGCKNSTIPTDASVVTKLGTNAFVACKGLTDIVIPENITEISGSFDACENLKSVTISSSVTKIGQYAFRGCAKLESITYTGTVEQWNAIDRHKSWSDKAGDYTVTCTDGKLDKTGKPIAS